MFPSSAEVPSPHLRFAEVSAATLRLRAVACAAVLVGVCAPVAPARASTIDLGIVLGNSGYESGNISQWTVTKPNASYQSIGPNFGVNPTIVPLDPCCSDGTTLPALTAPDGSYFIGVRNPTLEGDLKGKLAHDALAGSFSSSDTFQVTLFANRGRLDTNGNSNSTFPGSTPVVAVQFLGWGAGAIPTVNSSDNWSRAQAVNTSLLFTSWGDPGEWTSQTFTFTPAMNLSFISLAVSGQNNNHDRYVAWDIGGTVGETAVPEPASILLLGSGLAALLRWKKRPTGKNLS